MDSWKGTGLEQIQQATIMTATSRTIVAPIANFFGGVGMKHKDRNNVKSKGRNWRYFGPGGALGIGCGAGIGVAITGGAGAGASPWNALRLVYGAGVGCGVGLGYGYGVGLGVRWDQRPKKNTSKKLIIEI